jgi:hypothetical protein
VRFEEPRNLEKEPRNQDAKNQRKNTKRQIPKKESKNIKKKKLNNSQIKNLKGPNDPEAFEIFYFLYSFFDS